MIGANFTLEGSENLKTIFRELSEKGYRQPVIAAFRKAAKPVANAMAANLPKSLSNLKKIIRTKPGRGKSMILTVGFTGGIAKFTNSRGQFWDPYQIALWHNYGTLDWRANRFYQFKTPVRRKTSSESMQGLKPKLFVERGVDQSMPEAQRVFESEFEKESIKFLEKYAAR
jgi:hypothetical protein